MTRPRVAAGWQRYLMQTNAYPVALNDPVVIARARLPVVYEAACVALQQCADVDECKLWADKMSALQSYARQDRRRYVAELR